MSTPQPIHRGLSLPLPLNLSKKANQLKLAKTQRRVANSSSSDTRFNVAPGCANVDERIQHPGLPPVVPSAFSGKGTPLFWGETRNHPTVARSSGPGPNDTPLAITQADRFRTVNSLDLRGSR